MFGKRDVAGRKGFLRDMQAMASLFHFPPILPVEALGGVFHKAGRFDAVAGACLKTYTY